jgi:diguanylate cyclase (GGDEF)-like protein
LTPYPRQLYSSVVSKDSGRRAGSPRNERNIRLLEALDIFRSLDPGELAIIADSSGRKHYAGGEMIFGQGAGREGEGGRLYVVESGEVLITKSGDQQRDITLATFVQGDSFGELSLFDREPSGTIARCEQDTTLLVFPVSGDADTLCAEHPRIAAKVLRNLLAMVARRIRSTNRLIAEKSPWVQELRRQVMLDKLTGLYNAMYLEEELIRLIEGKPDRLCLLMIKPDNLKDLNDRYGHKAGDRTIQLMAGELRGRASGRGTAVRYKGDVFALILPASGLKTARKIAEEVRCGMQQISLGELAGWRELAGESSLRKHDPSSGEGLRITVSVGVASYPRGGGSPSALVERAYQNLFTARNRGGNRIYSRQEGENEKRPTK